MRSVLTTILLLGLWCPSSAQWWTDAGLPVDAPQVAVLYVDTANSAMYCTGTVVDDFATPDQAYHYCVLANGSWVTSVPFDLPALSVVVFHDTLFVGGAFTTVDGVPMAYIACYANGTWSPYGVFDAQINRLKVLDGDLYALGSFTYANGQLCQGVAKRVGGSWQAIAPVGCDGCIVRDAVMYNGELCISGSIIFLNQDYAHVLRYHNNAWVPIGPYGILGGLSGGGPLCVYQGELYLGGMVDIAAGNAGHAIMRWDGTEWHSVGTGVQDETGGYNYLIRVQSLQEHAGLLFASGGFDYAGNVSAKRIATWNGSEWCSVGGDFGEWEVFALAFLNDTLFATCWDVADGQFVNHLARFIAPAYEGNCSVPMSTFEEVAQSVEVVPLGDGRYVLRGGHGVLQLRLRNMLGQVLAESRVSSDQPFRFDGLASGIYVLDIPSVGVARPVWVDSNGR
jgi:hypothetical protein